MSKTHGGDIYTLADTGDWNLYTSKKLELEFGSLDVCVGVLPGTGSTFSFWGTICPRSWRFRRDDAVRSRYWSSAVGGPLSCCRGAFTVMTGGWRRS